MANQGVGNLGFGGGFSGGSTGIIVNLAPNPTQTPATLDISGVLGNTLATWTSFTFIINSGTMLIGGVTFQPGTYTFGNGTGVLAPISYDATASSSAQIIAQS
jgi:hypothetical protein